MSPEEREAFLQAQRTCRVATIGADGSPHVSALWFVWDGSALWMNSVVASQRWTNVVRDPRVSVLVDAGEAFTELCGVELIGTVEVVGEVPRTAEPSDALAVPEAMFGAKYAGGAFVADGRHAWLRLVPEKVVSWDFRKLVAARSG
ncbi:MAG: pyridoxamine 5'-phosphate oxidase family protein [Mycobacteriales bacterium]